MKERHAWGDMTKRDKCSSWHPWHHMIGLKPSQPFTPCQPITVGLWIAATELTFYTFYTSHLRWNNTMRRCFNHTDLGQNAVFHNFAVQISLIKYSGRWKHAWAFSETVKKISKITHTASRFATILTSAKWMNNYRVTLQQSKEFIMFIMFIIIFLFDGFITMCNLRKRLIRAAFWVLLQAVFMNDWK